MSSNYQLSIPSTRAGFTIVELLVSMAIISVLTTVVMFRYTDFNNQALLQAQAYELALDVRTAQTFSLSVRSHSGGGFNDQAFREEYGIYFSIDTASDRGQYIFYQDSGSVLDAYYHAGEELEIISLDPRYEIVSICMSDNNNPNQSYCPNAKRLRHLSVYFERPNFDARFYGRDTKTGNERTHKPPNPIDEVYINITPLNDINSRYKVIVSSQGQIRVEQ